MYMIYYFARNNFGQPVEVVKHIIKGKAEAQKKLRECQKLNDGNTYFIKPYLEVAPN